MRKICVHIGKGMTRRITALLLAMIMVPLGATAGLASYFHSRQVLPKSAMQQIYNVTFNGWPPCRFA